MTAVAVLGAGTVGRTLANGWARSGHQVILGSREPAATRIQEAVAELSSQSGGTVTAMSHRDAVSAADAVLLAVPGDQVPTLIAALGSGAGAERASGLVEKIVIDATNNTAGPVMNSVQLLESTGAIAFRAFNTVGWEQMQAPVFGRLRADMPYAGPGGEADAVVARLITDIGFRPIALGDDADALAAVDALARLWFLLAFRRRLGRRVGFRILTAQDDAAD